MATKMVTPGESIPATFMERGIRFRSPMRPTPFARDRATCLAELHGEPNGRK